MFDFFNKIGPKADIESLTGRNPSFRHSGHAHPFYQTVSLIQIGRIVGH